LLRRLRLGGLLLPCFLVCPDRGQSMTDGFGRGGSFPHPRHHAGGELLVRTVRIGIGDRPACPARHAAFRRDVPRRRFLRGRLLVAVLPGPYRLPPRTVSWLVPWYVTTLTTPRLARLPVRRRCRLSVAAGRRGPLRGALVLPLPFGARGGSLIHKCPSSAVPRPIPAY